MFGSYRFVTPEIHRFYGVLLECYLPVIKKPEETSSPTNSRIGSSTAFSPKMVKNPFTLFQAKEHVNEQRMGFFWGGRLFGALRHGIGFWHICSIARWGRKVNGALTRTNLAINGQKSPKAIHKLNTI